MKRKNCDGSVVHREGKQWWHPTNNNKNMGKHYQILLAGTVQPNHKVWWAVPKPFAEWTFSRESDFGIIPPHMHPHTRNSPDAPTATVDACRHFQCGEESSQSKDIYRCTQKTPERRDLFWETYKAWLCLSGERKMKNRKTVMYSSVLRAHCLQYRSNLFRANDGMFVILIHSKTLPAVHLQGVPQIDEVMPSL